MEMGRIAWFMMGLAIQDRVSLKYSTNFNSKMRNHDRYMPLFSFILFTFLVYFCIIKYSKDDQLYTLPIAAVIMVWQRY